MTENQIHTWGRELTDLYLKKVLYVGLENCQETDSFIIFSRHREEISVYANVIAKKDGFPKLNSCPDWSDISQVWS